MTKNEPKHELKDLEVIQVNLSKEEIPEHGGIDLIQENLAKDLKITSISIGESQLRDLYWGESGTPEDWHSPQEIADVFGCTVQAIEDQLAEHEIKRKTDLDILYQAIWNLLIDWGLEPEFKTRVNMRPAHFSLEREEDSLAFWVRETMSGDPKVLLTGEWTLVELPGLDPQEDVLRFVSEFLEEFEFKKQEKEDGSQDIQW